MEKQVYDVTIVGGGPAGMFAAFYAGLRELKAQLIESLPQLGGQVNALYPEKTILDVAGLPNIQANQLVSQLQTQMREAPIDTFLGETVEDVVKDEDGFKIVTNQRTSYSKTVIIALGNGAFTPRPLAIDNVAQFENKQLFYFVTHKEDFKNKRVLIAGGGDSAVDMALMLEPIASKVYLMHRRETFRGLEHDVTLLKQSSVSLQVPYLLKQIEQTDAGALDLTMKKMRTDEEKHLQVDDVIVNYGFTSDNKALTSWSLDFEEQRHDIVVNSEMLTSVPGVYAIGDGINYPGKVKLIATAFGEAPTAISAIVNQLYPGKRAPIHSTSIKLDQK
ncbi:NAD(P)/FAD-dependent oxidoreductase [Paucilactobacillus wasatchensis]|uniref:Ferredoxin--NADP reductase n=1 Tax=Paucilactobacillus wasatchensis TaxID=1335616 RepID=A0A0D1A7K6_9LACO|nr:NAD(P)/FAD-dependent oxidoreductase [Paucilactobacillus wasatchensis]KIS03647.1 Thioredoxin reductase [Paucilactobacillus wasatchensis]